MLRTYVNLLLGNIEHYILVPIGVWRMIYTDTNASRFKCMLLHIITVCDSLVFLLTIGNYSPRWRSNYIFTNYFLGLDSKD